MVPIKLQKHHKNRWGTCHKNAHLPEEGDISKCLIRIDNIVVHEKWEQEDAEDGVVYQEYQLVELTEQGVLLWSEHVFVIQRYWWEFAHERCIWVTWETVAGKQGHTQPNGCPNMMKLGLHVKFRRVLDLKVNQEEFNCHKSNADHNIIDEAFILLKATGGLPPPRPVILLTTCSIGCHSTILV